MTVFFRMPRRVAYLLGLLFCCWMLAPSLMALPQGRFGLRQGQGPLPLQGKLQFLFGETEIRNWFANKHFETNGKKAGSHMFASKNPFEKKIDKTTSAPHGRPIDVLLLEKEAVLGRASQKADWSKAGSIYGLTYKNGEYLYGQLQIRGTQKIYRCKLWEKNGLVFLRIYGPYTWHTWVLEKL